MSNEQLIAELDKALELATEIEKLATGICQLVVEKNGVQTLR